ncbi:hypothetical protein [Mesorhizobium sp. ZC-5]|uniref:hypothetical protein n=1 Tax=Mesorhizobium sp. ZC-5 TaxID=2986066 RepID=UPI0021E76B27|nr:hypothetical protein [Mesorhizobium sp. ZC-5]MCV3239099.1 hypothetical protein [Mesorhizobium sp. ZC-5]
MDWSVEMEAKEAMLRRIVAMLYSLANLAEQAAGRSPAIRHLVLLFLRPAESLAREMVIRNAQHVAAPVPELLVADWTDGSADDAMRLARRFRALALTLESLVALMLAADALITGHRAGANPLRALRQTMSTLRSLLDCIPGRLEPVMQPDTS